MQNEIKLRYRFKLKLNSFLHRNLNKEITHRNEEMLIILVL
jgi:hypothetical protein